MWYARVMKQQVVYIHGGDTFPTYEEYLNFLRAYTINFERVAGTRKKWADVLQERLGEDFEVIAPIMPSKYNARYVEWKIWFEKFLPFLRDGVIITGGSLGGIFVAKYLSENNFPVRIKGTILSAAPYDDSNSPYSLVDFVLPESLTLLEQQGGALYLLHSKDDPIVNFGDLAKYVHKLPMAHALVFEDRGHFAQEEFPEFVELVKSIAAQHAA